jgi:hypothetical protein
VLDLVTGGEGSITRDTVEHICTAAGCTKRVQTFSVTLANGSTVPRSKKQLAVLPPCLVGALCFHPPLES